MQLMSKMTLSETCESKFHGLWNLTGLEECPSCHASNATLLTKRLSSATYEEVWPITGRWPCVMNWTLQHPLSHTCCCGALREDALDKLFIEGSGSIDLMPNKNINNVQFDLQLALTGLLTYY